MFNFTDIDIRTMIAKCQRYNVIHKHMTCLVQANIIDYLRMYDIGVLSSRFTCIVIRDFRIIV